MIRARWSSCKVRTDARTLFGGRTLNVRLCWHTAATENDCAIVVCVSAFLLFKSNIPLCTGTRSNKPAMHITLAFAAFAIAASTAVAAAAFHQDAVPLLQAMSPRNSISARQVDVGGASLGECAQLRACQEYGTQSVKCVQDFAASDRGSEDYACQCDDGFFRIAIE